jgi:hypothetical protein
MERNANTKLSWREISLEKNNLVRDQSEKDLEMLLYVNK